MKGSFLKLRKRRGRLDLVLCGCFGYNPNLVLTQVVEYREVVSRLNVEMKGVADALVTAVSRLWAPQLKLYSSSYPSLFFFFAV